MPALHKYELKFCSEAWLEGDNHNHVTLSARKLLMITKGDHGPKTVRRAWCAPLMCTDEQEETGVIFQGHICVTRLR
jgi:hypothetical protein